MCFFCNVFFLHPNFAPWPFLEHPRTREWCISCQYVVRIRRYPGFQLTLTETDAVSFGHLSINYLTSLSVFCQNWVLSGILTDTDRNWRCQFWPFSINYLTGLSVCCQDWGISGILTDTDRNWRCQLWPFSANYLTGLSVRCQNWAISGILADLDRNWRCQFWPFFDKLSDRPVSMLSELGDIRDFNWHTTYAVAIFENWGQDQVGVVSKSWL